MAVDSTPSSSSSAEHTARFPSPALAARSVIGGLLMGVANVIPGVSGGTMLLAVGIYREFIESIAQVSTLRIRLRPLVLIALIAGSALGAIAFLAAPVSELVIHQRWIMYSIFIGLTLGGVPIIWRLLKPANAGAVVGALIGLVVMTIMALIGPSEAAADGDGHAYVLYFVAGLAAASAMVLPGISGSYLLLVLGQYVAILTTVAALKDGLKARDLDAIMATMHVVAPVGIGVVVGVVGVSNLIRILLARFEKPTLGVLLGLLLGTVIGLYPFQEGVAPEVGSVFRGDVVAESADGVLIMEAAGREIEPKHWSTQTFPPSAGQIAGAVGLVVVGFVASMGIGRIGGNSEGEQPVEELRC